MKKKFRGIIPYIYKIPESEIVALIKQYKQNNPDGSMKDLRPRAVNEILYRRMDKNE